MGKKCANKTVMVLGIIELIISLALIGCGVFEIIYHSYLYFVGHGLWGGLLLALTSIFGITAGRYEKTGLHITHMVLAILSCIFIIPSVNALFGVETSADGHRDARDRAEYFDERCLNCNYFSYNKYGDSYGSDHRGKSDCPDWCVKNMRASTNELFAMGFCGLLFIIMIISASFTCCAVCSCCGANVTNGVVYPNSQETVVVYSHPLQQQSQFAVQMQSPYTNPYYPAAANNAFEQTQMQVAPPPDYGQAAFSAALAGQSTVEHQQFQPMIAKPPNAAALYA